MFFFCRALEESDKTCWNAFDFWWETLSILVKLTFEKQKGIYLYCCPGETIFKRYSSDLFFENTSFERIVKRRPEARREKENVPWNDEDVEGWYPGGAWSSGADFEDLLISHGPVPLTSGTLIIIRGHPANQCVRGSGGRVWWILIFLTALFYRAQRSQTGGNETPRQKHSIWPISEWARPRWEQITKNIRECFYDEQPNYTTLHHSHGLHNIKYNG